MSRFDALLKKSVAEVNAGFEQAQKDLFEIVGEISRSVQDLGNFAINLTVVGSDVNGTTYRLTLDPDTNDLEATPLRLLTLNIPTKGYPIGHGVYSKLNEEFRPHGSFLNIEELTSYFESLIGDPSSSLIQAIGFAMRKNIS